MTPQKRAINLARVSTTRQAELYSLDYQLEQERAYDEAQGFVVVAEFKDDVSGRKLERDGLEEACRMLENDQADVLVTWKFDRLHRNYVNSVLLRDRIRKAGKELHYAQTRQISGKTAREWLPEDVQYIMAEIEADDIRERTANGKRDAITKGKRWVAIYKSPYGYLKEGYSHDARMVVDEWEALQDPEGASDFTPLIERGIIPPEALSVIRAGKATALIVRFVFIWYVHGDESGKPLGVQQIIEKLSNLQIPTPQDIIPARQHMPKRGFGIWSTSTLYRILWEGAYGGTFYHYRFKMVDGVKQVNYDRETWEGVPVPRIVDEAIFTAAQAKLASGRRLSRRSSTERYLVGRRISCECGYKIHANQTTSYYTAADGTKKVYYSFIYRCPGRIKRNIHLMKCDMPQVQVKQVDKRVWEWVKEEIGNPVVLERKLREVQDAQGQKNTGKEATLATIKQHKTALETELKNLATLYATSSIPGRLVDELIAEKSQALKL